MTQVCSVVGKGLGLLPNRAPSASVRRPSANDGFLGQRTGQSLDSSGLG
jgi:hypothetical protein